MNVYVTSLFFAIPTFVLLIVIEIIVANKMGVKINNHADMISSLSSGMTNTIKDALKFGIVIISYAWLVEKITIYKLEPIWLAVLFAFVVEDFAGYWMHRLHHRVNVFWNRHIIHHSSEEFNLSCALRQSISTTFRFSAILMIPAALMGIPATIFAILSPVHLFLQFWYHTRLIGKLGILEYILVTPSHHRVHHGINPEYLDKNYSQIFIFWDKMFNTFQPELDDVKPVYGTLRPVSTWNPIIINYKHIWQIIKDTWHTKSYLNKIKVWFMPTGWRPDDVKQRFPLKEVKNPYKQIKYAIQNPPKLIVWTWVQYIITSILMFHFFIIMESQSTMLNYIYAVFLIVNIFSFTAILDNQKYIMIVESLKSVFMLGLIYFQGFSWFNLNGIYVIILLFYSFISPLVTYYFYNYMFTKYSLKS